ncbi:alpha/beta hydrolase [Sphingomonas sp. SUN039]|uniref:alpha/beta hydrolase n=1 Tax=Sphingomonas sp. SUN039 TaxID=2937787 RepID=UPI00216406C7|nr:alpha/beta hydrolase [Sphingomonas sp. SUN039]UVO54142.1 alpha/beta hydrolase [Sphingomonas sp. SUN039]
MIDRRTLMGATLAASLAARASAQTPPPVKSGALPAGLPQPVETIDLWPKGAPGAPKVPLVETVNERSTDPQLTDRAVFGISRPRLVVFRPDVPNGAAVLITPGGGYKWVVIDKEGYELGRWLSARGFTVFVLFYRLPGEGWAAGPDVALSDAQRAMRLIRQRATHYGVDPERVCAMGFSAGGHVCTDLVARFAAPTYAPVDAADALSPRPFCAAPIYPVVSMDRKNAHPGSRKLLIDDNDALEAAHSPHLNIAANSPPCFLVHAEDDDVVPVANTLMFRDALKAKGIKVETHLFANGGHGFGLRKAIGKPVGIWPELFLGWAKSVALI